MCYRIVIFPYLLKSWNWVRVIATGYPVPKTGNAANHVLTVCLTISPDMSVYVTVSDFDLKIKQNWGILFVVH